jgi:hypothetical protein
MTAIQIIPVENSRQRKAFLNFFYDLYRDCPYAVPYLYIAEKLTLRPDSNPAFAFCEAQCFLALKDGKVAGRVAAIINRHANEHWQRKMVRFGWFDFVDDPAVSEALLKAVADWGKSERHDGDCRTFWL